MLVTVYMPTRNRAAMLESAIESVLDQTYSHFELIVVDDASDDYTPEVLKRISASDPRVKVLRNGRALGGGGARNVAILAASGEFVTGLDDDDAFLPDRLERFVAAWKTQCEGGVVPSCLYSQLNVVEFGNVTHRTAKPQTANFDDMFSENVVGNQIFAPKSHFVEAGLFDPALPAWQDLEFFMRVLKKFGPGKLVNEATYNFENSPRDDRISRKSEAKMRAAFDIVRKHADGDARRAQRLYLQLFNRLYGIRPGLDDYRDFVRMGFWVPGLLRLMKSSVA